MIQVFYFHALPQKAWWRMLLRSVGSATAHWLLWDDRATCAFQVQLLPFSPSNHIMLKCGYWGC